MRQNKSFNIGTVFQAEYYLRNLLVSCQKDQNLKLFQMAKVTMSTCWEWTDIQKCPW